MGLRSGLTRLGLMLSNIGATALEDTERAYVSGAVPGRAMKKAQELAAQVQLAGRKAWRSVIWRPAAPSSGSRQNERRAWCRSAFKSTTERYPGNSRAERRRIAGKLGKRLWRKDRGLVEHWEPMRNGRRFNAAYDSVRMKWAAREAAHVAAAREALGLAHG
mgnify:CR=1 FL=1